MFGGCTHSEHLSSDDTGALVASVGLDSVGQPPFVWGGDCSSPCKNPLLNQRVRGPHLPKGRASERAYAREAGVAYGPSSAQRRFHVIEKRMYPSCKRCL